jgi:hypothetical protein
VKAGTKIEKTRANVSRRLIWNGSDERIEKFHDDSEYLIDGERRRLVREEGE